MKTLPSALQARLSGGVTTLCYCWRLTRHDGTVLGFTEHDRDVTVAGTLFAAGTGFTASRMEQSLGLSIDNLQAAGALSSAGITEADILAGRYDGAAVESLGKAHGGVHWFSGHQQAVWRDGQVADALAGGVPDGVGDGRGDPA